MMDDLWDIRTGTWNIYIYIFLDLKILRFIDTVLKIILHSFVINFIRRIIYYILSTISPISKRS